MASKTSMLIYTHQRSHTICASLKCYRGKGTSASGITFGEIWMISESNCERTRTGLIQVALTLDWPAAVHEERKEMWWEEKRQGKKGCVKWKPALGSGGRIRNVPAKIDHEDRCMRCRSQYYSVAGSRVGFHWSCHNETLWQPDETLI